MVSLFPESEDALRARLRKMDDDTLQRYITATKQIMQDQRNPNRERAAVLHRVAQEVWPERHSPPKPNTQP